MKSISVKTIFIACLLFCSSTVFSQSPINCDLLHGNWMGEHKDDQGHYSRWTASYLVDGRLELVFFDTNGAQVSTQEGGWECEDGILSTIMFSGLEKLEFDYQILSLDRLNVSYQSFYDRTVFTSTRLSE